MRGYNLSNGLRKEFEARGINPDTTIVTPDNIDLLITKDSLRRVCNAISIQLNRRLSTTEVQTVYEFMKGISGVDFYGKPLAFAEQCIARNYVSRSSHQLPFGDPNEYQKSELMQYTPDENAFKHASFADRRGNAVIDRPTERQPSADQTNKAMYDMAKIITAFFDPASIDKMLSRIQSVQTTFYNINLPHQIIPLDSRGRRPTGRNDEYTWNVNMTGRPGVKGDLWVQDTIQQDIQMRIYPFWIPNHRITDPYQKIRITIREFIDQSVRAAEFIGPSEATEINPFHFELEIVDTIGNRSLLKAKQDTFSFRRVLAQVNTITIAFRTPYAPLELEPDSGVFSVTTGSPTIFGGTVPHNLDTGDLIYVQNFASPDAALNNELNSQNGWIVTVLNSTDFSIIADTSAVPNQSNVYVYYGSKRITIDLEFTQLEQ